MNARQGDLFSAEQALPAGMIYELDFLAPAEEADLLEAIRALPLEEARYKEYTAKRRIVSYGSSCDFDANERRSEPPIPPFLVPLRDRAARRAGLPPRDFVHALVSEYRPGTALGWHRDVPDFETIVGISLGSSCRMRFRPYPRAASRQPSAGRRLTAHDSRVTPFELLLEPRSAYVLRGPARWDWQHSIPPTKTLRYSITFRTLSARAGRRPMKES